IAALDLAGNIPSFLHISQHQGEAKVRLKGKHAVYVKNFLCFEQYGDVLIDYRIEGLKYPVGFGTWQSRTIGCVHRLIAVGLGRLTIQLAPLGHDAEDIAWIDALIAGQLRVET